MSFKEDWKILFKTQLKTKLDYTNYLYKTKLWKQKQY